MSRTLKWVLAAVAAVLVVLGGSSAAYASYYADRAVPGTQVAGKSVSGMTAKEVAEDVQKRFDEFKTNITVDGRDHELSLAQLGVSLDEDATASAALTPSATVWSRIQGLFSAPNVPLSVEVNHDKIAQFTDSLIAELGDPVQNASVKFDEGAEKFASVPAVEGHGIDTQGIADHVLTTAKSLNPQPVSFESSIEAPKIATERAQQVADKANEMISIPVVISTGNREILPEAKERAAWVDIEADGEQIQDPVLNDPAAREWLVNTAASTNDEPVEGIHNVNTRGDVVSTAEEGSPGYTVNNLEAIADALIESLKAGQPYEGLLTYDETPQQFSTRLIAPGAESLAYQAAPGEKWVDINLSNATVTAFEGATVVRGPVPMVPGAPGLETVTGKFRIYLKYESQTMRGQNLDGSRYETPDVPWVTYFVGSYAFHGAPWRSSFGWSGPGGSHGCVNMPVSEAKWLYDWGEIGNVVVSHY